MSVSWSFIETSCTRVGAFLCNPPPGPQAIFSLTLSSGTESGSATWAGPPSHVYPYPAPYQPPAVTDPGFAFSGINGDLAVGLALSGPDFLGLSPFGLGNPELSAYSRGYSFSWEASGGQFLALHIDFASIHDRMLLGLDGGLVGSDGAIAYCNDGPCQIAGFWQPSNPVAPHMPEPGSLVLFVTALFCAALLRHHRNRGRKIRRGVASFNGDRVTTAGAARR